MPLTIDSRLQFESKVHLGDVLDVEAPRGVLSGTLEEVTSEGIFISWKAIVYSRMNGKLGEDVITKTLFIPFDEIITYTICR